MRIVLPLSASSFVKKLVSYLPVVVIIKILVVDYYVNPRYKCMVKDAYPVACEE